MFPLDWSSDGRFVLYQQNNPATRSDILLLPLAKGSTPVPFVNSAANETDAQFSPNGKWIAYTSDTSGSPQIYVQAFQGARAASGAALAGVTKRREQAKVAARWPASCSSSHPTDN